MNGREGIAALIERSHRHGADRSITNYAGGNTSVKGLARDPVSGDDVELLWVKGSGGDLGTLTEDGLAILRLDRLRRLATSRPAARHEDELVADLELCLHGRGAAPSIDTAMHGLVPAAHVDHLHPESGLALATAADGEALTRECFGERVAWLPWIRPGFELGARVAELADPGAGRIGVILGGHGITAWGDTSASCEANALEIIRTAERFIAERGRPEPFGPLVEAYRPRPADERRARAVALLPLLRGLCSTDRPVVGHFDDSEVVLDFLAREAHPRLAARGGSCPDHFLRTKVRPMVVDAAPDAPPEQVEARIRELHAAYRAAYRDYYEAHATPESPSMRGADPAVVLVPGIGLFAFGADKQTARVAAEFTVNAVHAMRGAEAISTYAPIGDRERFDVEYWSLEEAKLARRPRPRALATRIALVTGAASGIGKAIAGRLAAEGACVALADRDGDAARSAAEGIGTRDRAVALTVDVTDEAAIRAAVEATVLAFGGLDLVVNDAGLSIGRPLLETSAADWDVQHDVMARGSFLVSREATRVMVEQAMGGDIVYVASKNAVVAGPENLAYAAAKADQAHQVRVLAAELGEHGIRVNGVHPDAVVRGSGIFTSEWAAQRAARYGIAPEELGTYYAGRTLLKLEVLPEHVAAAVFVLVGGELSRTTGTFIPVDAGIAAAFPR